MSLLAFSCNSVAIKQKSLFYMLKYLLEVIILSFQVFNKLLSLASTASSQKFQSHMWSQMLVSTSGFLKSISNVSGKDIQPLIKQWVYPFYSWSGLLTWRMNLFFN